ncbi:MAG: hypothetical protein AAF515_02160 [Pseudomonadota bacterium]
MIASRNCRTARTAQLFLLWLDTLLAVCRPVLVPLRRFVRLRNRGRALLVGELEAPLGGCDGRASDARQRCHGEGVEVRTPCLAASSVKATQRHA